MTRIKVYNELIQPSTKIMIKPTGLSNDLPAYTCRCKKQEAENYIHFLMQEKPVSPLQIISPGRLFSFTGYMNISIMGGGVAVGDINNDGLRDLFSPVI